MSREGLRILIADGNMPGMPGIDLLRAVRADAKLPVRMRTVEASREQIVTAPQAGCNDDHVTARFVAVTLREKLDRIFDPVGVRHGFGSPAPGVACGAVVPGQQDVDPLRPGPGL